MRTLTRHLLISCILLCSLCIACEHPTKTEESAVGQDMVDGAIPSPVPRIPEPDPTLFAKEIGELLPLEGEYKPSPAETVARAN